jgi:predicted DNA binding protein
MHVLVLEIQHLDCSLAALSLRWPRVELLLRAPMAVEGRAAGVLAVRAPSEAELDLVAKDFEAERGDRPVPLLREGALGFWQILSPERPNIISAVARHRGFPLDAVRVKNGVETWTLGVSDREQAKAILDALAGMGPLKVLRLSKGTFPDLRLTGAQLRVLRAAIVRGYYEFPRRTSPTKLAKELGLAKSTVLEHLQRAEAKVILGAEGFSTLGPAGGDARGGAERSRSRSPS